jgi:putative hemolysin
MVEAGETGAQAAMDLHENPTKFLSTVQIGITSIGVLNGIVGEAAFSGRWRNGWRPGHVPGGGRHPRATALVVVIITLLTIIFGELVPKRLGQMYPETVARLVARPMNACPRHAAAGGAADGLHQRRAAPAGHPRRAVAAVTEEEIAAQLEEGLDAGVIEEQEHQMVRNVFRLDDRQIGSMMIPRAEIVWIDAEAALDRWWRRWWSTAHALPGVPRRAGRRDRRAGAPGCCSRWRAASALNLTEGWRRRCSCPRRCRAWNCWSTSATARADLVFVVDEYGAVQGVIASATCSRPSPASSAPRPTRTPGPCAATTAAG